MDIFSIILIVAGLVLFETVNSVDNAIINAEVLSKMSPRARRWFLVWGILFAVFIVRGILPWLIIFFTVPELGLWGSLTATFTNDPVALEAIDRSAPILLMGGGIFLVFLALHWLFSEPKNYGLKGERFFHKHGLWFYAIVSLILTTVVWYALDINTMLAFGAVVGSSAFFITHGFKQQAEEKEREMLKNPSATSDVAKIAYLEVIDATFSIDGVLGAFAFTLSIPLILIGNGIGAVVVRQLTIHGIERIKKYAYLKNGAMYSIFVLGSIMMLHGFGFHIPEWVSPVVTFAIIGYFFHKSVREMAR